MQLMLTPGCRRVVPFSHVGVDSFSGGFCAVHVNEDIDGVVVNEFGIAENTWMRRTSA
jgi:hypothetical protein